MKKFTKLLGIVLIMALVMSMGTAAFAAATDYQITIDNAVAGETYSAYKVFDVTYSGTNDSYATPTPATDIPGDPNTAYQHTAFSYTIGTTSAFWTDLTTNDATNNPVTVADGTYTLSKFGLKFVPTTTSGLYNVMPVDETTGVTAAQAQALAAFLATKVSGKTAAASATASATTNDHGDYKTGSLTLNVGDSGAGYYFVDTTTGSLCSLDTTEPTVVIREKNDLPSQEKKVSDAATGTFGDEATIKVGDTAYFQITVTNAKGTDQAIKVHDTMSTGLTLDADSFVLKNGTTTLTAGTDYTIVISSALTEIKDDTTLPTGTSKGTLSDGCTFEIVLAATYVAGMGDTETVVVTYEAELNQNAQTVTPFQINKSKITYSNQSTVEDTVTVKTYQVDVVKTDDQKKVLDGATFNLYDAATAGTKYNLVMVGTPVSPATTTGVYKIKSSEVTGDPVEKLIPLNGKLTIIGLENGTYYLEEVDHPEGYNPLTARKDFTIADANNSATIDGTTYTSGGVQVINQSGAVLPSTGGIGTTIFYVVGSILVVAAGVLLITKKRMSREG